MFAATVALFILASCIGIAQHLHGQQRKGALNTFLVDPPTMLIVGALAGLLGLLTRKGRKLALAEFRTRRVWIDRFLALFFVCFVCAEMLSYFDLTAHPYDPTKTGNDFMWNGYTDLLGWAPFHFDQPTYHYLWAYPFVAAMLALQWLCLRAGRALAYSYAERHWLANERTEQNKSAAPAQKRQDGTSPLN